MRFLVLGLFILLAKGAARLLRTLARRIRSGRNRQTLAEQLSALGAEVQTISSQNLYTASARRRTDPPPLMAQPDSPRPFGYCTSWLAIKDTPPETVAALLGDFRQTATWATGLAQVEAGEGLFVSPDLDGWVLVVGYYANEDASLVGLAARFPEVQYFCTHRVTEYHRWARYQAGRLVRDYCWCGERGDVLRDEGAWTPQEQALGFDAFPRLGEDWAACQRLPDEEDVLSIAAAWGVDTTFSTDDYPPSLGWVCPGAGAER